MSGLDSVVARRPTLVIASVLAVAVTIFVSAGGFRSDSAEPREAPGPSTGEPRVPRILFPHYSQPTVDALRRRLDRELKRLGAKTRVSVHVIDAVTGQEIFDRSSRTPLVPASNMKVLTGAAALSMLGADYEFETIFGSTVKLDEEGAGSQAIWWFGGAAIRRSAGDSSRVTR